VIRDPAKNGVLEFGTRLHAMEPALKVEREPTSA
jgi:hypothetical protein